MNISQLKFRSEKFDDDDDDDDDNKNNNKGLENKIIKSQGFQVLIKICNFLNRNVQKEIST